jgi:predicted dehydrogenase
MRSSARATEGGGAGDGVTAPPVRLGFVGAEHPHLPGLLASALRCPTAQVVGLSARDTEHRRLLAEMPGEAPPVFATDEELYERTRPDAVVVCTDNRRAAIAVADAARRGVHVMKEKPLAADLASAQEMVDVAAANRIRLMVNWKTCWWPAVHHAKLLTGAGVIGRVLGIRHRAGHGGPPADFAQRGPAERVSWGWLSDPQANGGGAAVDFCCYGAALAVWFVGRAERVMAHGGRYVKDFLEAEDDAVMILAHRAGHSVIEGTWTEAATPVTVPTMIYGERGAIAVTAADQLRVASADGRPGSAQPETPEPGLLPASYRSGPDHFTSRLLDGTPFDPLADVGIALAAQEILHAGLQSMASACSVAVPSTHPAALP